MIARKFGLASAWLLLAACSADAGGDAPPPAANGGNGGPSVASDAGARDAALADTGAIDAGDGAASPDAASADASDASSAPTCGDAPARFTLLAGADAGLVRDNVTTLTWMRDSVGGGEPPQTQSLAQTYCAGRAMRLPTKDEAVALAAAYAPCAFGRWGTWTSTSAPAQGYAWVVDYLGGQTPQVADNFPSAVLCVRDGK